MKENHLLQQQEERKYVQSDFQWLLWRLLDLNDVLENVLLGLNELLVHVLLNELLVNDLLVHVWSGGKLLGDVLLDFPKQHCIDNEERLHMIEMRFDECHKQPIQKNLVDFQLP